MKLGKFLPYIISALGLIGIIISGEKIHPTIPLINIIPRSIVLIAGIILVGVGIILMMGKGKKGDLLGKQKEKEVPIYKDKKIIGYRVKS